MKGIFWMEGELKICQKYLRYEMVFLQQEVRTPFAKACNEVLDYYLILIKKGDEKQFVEQ